MTIDCLAFYSERDRRTRQYLPGWDAHSRPVAVVPGSRAVRTPAGQVLLLALANQLARAHRRVTFVLPDGSIPVLARPRLDATDLQSSLLELVRTIDPCGVFATRSELPTADVSVGIGDAPGGLDWYLGAERAVGVLSERPVALTEDGTTTWGSAVASCLGASAVFRAASGIAVGSARLSAWSWTEGENADPGPASIPPLDVGSVLQVGAGAVGTSLDYWVDVVGQRTAWSVIDGDVIRIHNTNRSLLFLPRHAGWPDGEAQNKAVVASSYLTGAVPYPGWWADWTATAEADRPFDVVLPLANGPGVRESIAQLQCPVVLHATTSSNWSAQIHRHIAGIDDCISCRMADTPQAVFACSTGSVSREEEPSHQPGDAALPFLSAMSGLMLASSLARLQAGELHRGADNWWAVDLRSAHRMVSTGRHRCREGCETILRPTSRALIPGGRWSSLDPARTGAI